MKEKDTRAIKHKEDDSSVTKEFCRLRHNTLEKQMDNIADDVKEIKRAIVGNGQGLRTRVAITENELKEIKEKDKRRIAYFGILFTAVLGLTIEAFKHLFINSYNR